MLVKLSDEFLHRKKHEVLKNKESLLSEAEINLKDLRYFSKLPVEDKLDFLEQLQEFLGEAMPPENKKLWERLKEEGF